MCYARLRLATLLSEHDSTMGDAVKYVDTQHHPVLGGRRTASHVVDLERSDASAVVRN